jgi:biopolymer transport protein ExbD
MALRADGDRTVIRASVRNAREQANAEINMVPLIDIMLVLVIVLLVTAPLLTHAVKIDLPQAAGTPNKVEPLTITLSVNAVGALHWNRDQLPWKALAPRLEDLRGVTPEPEIHLRADGNTPYRKVVRVMSAVSSAGLTRIGFVTDPTGTN